MFDCVIKFFSLSSIRDVRSGGNSVRMTSLNGSGVVISERRGGSWYKINNKHKM